MAIIRLPAVLARIGLSKSTLYQLIKDGQFPPPVKLTKRASGWHEQAVDAWIAARLS